MRKSLRFALLGTVVFFAITSKAQSATSSMDSSETYDTVVYGGTSAGVAAAIQVKRMPRTVIIACHDSFFIF